LASLAVKTVGLARPANDQP